MPSDPGRPASPDAPDLDVVVVGDGPAGAALAAACRDHGLEVVLVGPGAPWTATYGTWRDDVAGLPDEVFATVSDRVLAYGARRHELGRPYAVFDNAALRAHLLRGVDHLCATVDAHQEFSWGSRVLTGVGPLDARVVVDATGTRGRFLRRARGRQREPTVWQTAFGVVVPEIPSGSMVEPDAVTLMDFRQPTGVDGPVTSAPPTFCYVVPVVDGWLVEETVLAASPAVEPDLLRDRLVARLGPEGRDLVMSNSSQERVRIPMNGVIPPRDQRVVAFGAAAGYIHPATGYSVAASLRAAPRVAAAIAGRRDVWEAVWPLPHRRARALHDYGAATLLRFGTHDVQAFFDAFFDLPTDRWQNYLRVDTTPGAVAAVMRGVFSAAPWRIRRRLMAGDPSALLGLLRR